MKPTKRSKRHEVSPHGRHEVHTDSLRFISPNERHEVSDTMSIRIHFVSLARMVTHGSVRPNGSPYGWTINIILTLLFTLQAYISLSQNWPKYYGEPGRHDYSRDIMETYDQGYLICGGYFNDESTWAWLIKTNINGDTLWEKILECDGYNYLNAVHQAMDGGILACGAIKYNKSDEMPYVIKLDACGEKEWCKSYYTPEPIVLPWAQDIKETQSGDIIVLVNTFGDYPEETMHLFKLNAEGDVLWQKPYCSGYVYPEAAISLGNKLIITSNNEYLISGDVYWEDPWNPGGPKVLRPLFVMVDCIGVEKWVLPYGLTDTIYGTADNIIEINDDYFVGVGSYWTNQEYVEPLFMKFDCDGNELDHQILYTNQITPDLVGGSFIHSKLINSIFYSGGGFVYPNNLGYPIMEAKLHFDTMNFNFTPLLNKIYKENSDPYNLDKTSDNKLLSNSTFKEPYNWDIFLAKLNLNLEYDTAYTGNYTYDSLCIPGPPQSGFISLDDCDIVVGIDEMPTPEEYYESLKWIPIKAYPNPVREGEITFEFENTEHHRDMELRCYDLLGELVYSEKVYCHQGESRVSTAGWPPGMYVAIIYSNGGAVGKCKFVVE